MYVQSFIHKIEFHGNCVQTILSVRKTYSYVQNDKSVKQKFIKYIISSPF